MDLSSDSNTSKKFNQIIDKSRSYDQLNLIKNGGIDSSNSNETTQERLDDMKKQLSKKLNQTKVSNNPRNKRVPKSKALSKDSNPKTSSDSSPEEVIDSSYEFSDNSIEKQDNTLVPLLNLERENIEFDEEFVQNNSNDNFHIDDINVQCQELEEKALQERFMVEDILDKYSNKIMNNSDKNDFKLKREKNTDSRTKEVKNVKSLMINLEINNNDKISNRKMSSDLDEEKKKKLLATLKAIDRGDDDGLNFRSIRKFNNKDQISKN